jgi:uncharacterized protein (DUF302 family)
MAFTEIDHATAASKNGLTLTPRLVIVFGNPKLGTKPMEKAPTLAIDVPLNALVWQDDQNKVWLAYNSGNYLMNYVYPRHGLAMPAENAKAFDQVLARFAEEATRYAIPTRRARRAAGGCPQSPRSAWSHRVHISLDLQQPACQSAINCEVGVVHVRPYDAGKLASQSLRRTVEAEGRPALGMHVLVGDRLRQQRENSHRALLDGRACMVAIVARRPD